MSHVFQSRWWMVTHFGSLDSYPVTQPQDNTSLSKLRGAADVPCLSKWERDGKSGWMDPQLSLWAFIFSENYSSTSYSVTQPQPILLNQCPKQISADVRCLSKQETDGKSGKVGKGGGSENARNATKNFKVHTYELDL